MKQSKVLDIPFFTLEYREGVFLRRIPEDAEDLGDGLFRQGETLWRLPGGEGASPADQALAFGTVRGKALLSLINRGANPLIIAGPRLAAPGERIVELALVHEGGGKTGDRGADGAADAKKPGGGPVVMELRRRGLEAAEPLEGLPHHRLYQNTVYEIIGGDTLEELTAAYGAPGKPDRFILRGEDIPRFAETRPRLIYRFADPPLQKLLAEERVFVPGGELSLILSAYRKNPPGQAWARPAIKYRGRRYDGAELSGMMERDYVLLDDTWARREDIEKTGIFPLGCYAGGAAITDMKITAPELIRRGGGRFAGFFAALEADTGLWISRGDGETLFKTHLEFLCAWGFSGGLVLPGHREQARLLAAWLADLPRKPRDAAAGEYGASGPGVHGLRDDDAADFPGKAGFPRKVLVLMEKRYYDLYLAPLIPEPRLLLPGVCIAFSETLSPEEAASFWDLLILVEPEEILLDERGELIREETFARIAEINAGLRLGIFSDDRGIKNGPAANRMKALFGIRGEAGEITDWLIRDIRAPLPLPAYAFPPPAIRRPPLGTGAPFRYTVEAKFRDLPAAAVLSELACFDTPGEEAPFAPPPQIKREPDFDRMDEEARAFFLYWRRCFRNGEYAGGDRSKTGEAYIRLYARELCLFTGPEERRRPLNHFRELLRLWKTYRELFPGLNSFLPQWLLDFALIYGIDAGGLPLLLPFAGESGVPLLRDLFIHQHFIEENNLIGAADLRDLVPELSAPEDPFSSAGPPPDPRLIREFELAVNAVDRHLREHFRLRLFSFFYPPKTVTRSFTAFAGMAGAGYSSYTAEWIHFSGHPPLLRFLGDLFRYTEYWFNVKKGLEKQHRPPPLDEVWKQIVDPVLDFADRVPVPRTGPFAAGEGSEQPAGRRFRPGPKPVQLRLEFLDRLRAESDEVRDLLGTDEGREEGPGAEKEERGSETGEWKAVGWDQPREHPGGGDEAGFWDGLGTLEREALHIIVKGGAARAELEAWARKNGTMTELVIDGINEKFLALWGDLLVETVDEGPRIQSEYKEEVLSKLQF